VALDEPCDGRVIGLVLGGDHSVGDVLNARALDRPRGPHPARVRIEQQRHHHRRFIGRPRPPVTAIGAIERAEIHRRDGVQNEPREVILRQPLAHIGRHQERLLAITRDKARAHARIVLNRSDDSATYATAPTEGALPLR
jgi:hypothetical protein